MSVQRDTVGLAYATFGVSVVRATNTLPQTATGSIFTITNAGIFVTAIIGTVTTAIQNQANNTKLVATPSGNGAVNDLSAVVDVANLGLGGLLSFQGLAGDALVKSTGGGISLPRNPVYVAPGAIGVSCAASNTGSVQWTLYYLPAANNSTVVAA